MINIIFSIFSGEISMLRNEGDKLTRVIVCSPSIEYFNYKNRVLHNITQPADKNKAIQQHNSLKSILEKSGCEVIDVPELKDHPNSVFTRDACLCTPAGYINLRMGLKTRVGEEIWMSQTLNSLGEPEYASIKEPGTVEGGDIILAGSVVFVGLSKRTNKQGVKQISKLLNTLGYEIRAITVPSPFLHIGGAMSIIGPKKILCCKNVFPHNFFYGFNKIEISFNTFVSGNVICVGNNEIIADISNTEVINKLKHTGIYIHTIDLSEFVKGTGGPSCLIMPVERK
jgi:dimethylargininase